MAEAARQPGRRYRFADVVFDTGRRAVLRAGRAIEMPRLTYRLLLALVEAAPNVLGHDDLIERVWQGRNTTPETIKQRVKLLRDTLSDDATNPRYIGLVRGQGYRLLPAVRLDPDAPVPETRAATRRWRSAVAAGLAAVVAAVGLYVAPDITASRPIALAVLPFPDPAGDESRRFLADGVGDGLASELARLGRVDVVSRGSSLRYRDVDKGAAQIAAELDVDLLVEGSIEQDGGQIVLSVRLVDAATDRSAWAERFETSLDDLPATQRHIARRIGAEIGLSAAGSAEPARAVDPETYEAYLRGMYSLNKGTPDDIERGLAYLHQAVDADPGDALAYAGLALGYATYGHGLEPRHDVWPRARAAALRALTLDPTLAEAYAAIADVKLYSEWDWAGAEAAFARANELNPSLAMNHYHYAWYLALFGQFDEAIAEHERAKRLDPLTPLHTFWLGALYLYDDLARYDDARREVETALELSPGNPMALYVLGLAHSAAGEHDLAIETVERAARATPALRGPLGLIYSLAGLDEAAAAILAELEAARTTPWTAYWQFVLNARLGDLDRAFEWLAYEPHHAFVAWVRVDPWVRDLVADDPRYLAFVEELGLDP